MTIVFPVYYVTFLMRSENAASYSVWACEPLTCLIAIPAETITLQLSKCKTVDTNVATCAVTWSLG